AHFALQFPDLHRQCRLGDRTFLRGAAEVAVAGKRGEIAELAQGNHRNKIILSRWPNNTIRPDPVQCVKPPGAAFITRVRNRATPNQKTTTEKKMDAKTDDKGAGKCPVMHTR